MIQGIRDEISEKKPGSRKDGSDLVDSSGMTGFRTLFEVIKKGQQYKNGTEGGTWSRMSYSNIKELQMIDP